MQRKFPGRRSLLRMCVHEDAQGCGPSSRQVPPPHMTALSAELLRMYGTLCTMNRFLLRNL